MGGSPWGEETGNFGQFQGDYGLEMGVQARSTRSQHLKMTPLPGISLGVSGLNRAHCPWWETVCLWPEQKEQLHLPVMMFGRQ
jgi:hypothetical protein